MKDFDKKARAYALKNALAYEGKARTGSVISALFNEGLKKGEVKKYSRKINEIVAEVNKLSPDEQKREFGKSKKIISVRHGREGLPELPGAKKGKVIMRFAPSASGPLHIGHALTASISFLFVKEYSGKFYIRIEDTNPENIYLPAYKMIENESKWLFGKIARFVIQSDRMEIYYRYAEALIRRNAAYVCTCPSEEFRKFVRSRKNCPCRKIGVKENLERWKKMLGKNKNSFEEGGAVLRFKSEKSMQDKNPAMRDFPLARINLTKHPRQGKKYRVWPLMNLAVSADDIEQKMTHIIRGKDHRDNSVRQKLIYKALGKKSPWTGFLGRIKFRDMELSTTKIRQAIENGKYSGWDDPLLPTIASLRKRGYKPDAFWKFSEHMGISENDKVIEKKEFFRILDHFNRAEQKKK
jgi:glutamyl-tRNA synthetase